MAEYIIKGETLTNIADKVRTLSGTTDPMGLDVMAGHVNNANIDITSEGELIAQIINALYGKAAGTGMEIRLQTKTVAPGESVQEVTADDGYTALGKVTVEAIPEAYIIPGGTLDIIEAGSYDVTKYAMVNVNIESGDDAENQLDARLTNTLTDINSDITTIASYACYSATKITSVNLPNVTSIGSNAFRACSGIKTFYAPKTTSLGTYAFYGCSGLTELNFQNVTQAPSTCFYQCTSLTKIDLGPKCKTLAGSSFAYCSKLTHLILRYTEGVASIATNTFSGANFDGYVYVPSALLAAYESDSNWSSYAGSRVFRAIEDYPDICGNITA